MVDPAMEASVKFTLTDLSNRSGEIVDAAMRAPVELTKHGRSRFMLLSIDDYRALKGRADTRHAYLARETPPEVADEILPGLDALARGEGYDD